MLSTVIKIYPKTPHHQHCQEAFISLDGNGFVEQGIIPLSKPQQNIKQAKCSAWLLTSALLSNWTALWGSLPSSAGKTESQ